MTEQPCIYHSELFRSFHLILNSILFHTIQVHKLFSFDNRKKKTATIHNINKKTYSTIILTRMLHFMTTSIKKNKSRQLYIHR